jgi:hypothetical protein
MDQAEAFLLPCILNRTRKRSYPSYSYCRSSTIFASRNELLSYEEALRLEASVDAAFATKPNPTLYVGKNHFLESPRQLRARAVRNIWEKTWDKWADLVVKFDQSIKATGFERFESGELWLRSPQFFS